MSRLSQILDAFARNHQPRESWIELVRDLDAPIDCPLPKVAVSARLAGRDDLVTISAMQGFVKEVGVIERALYRGDMCMVLEREGQVCAFAHVTFRDVRLGPWHKLRLPPGFAYLVYIHVAPEFRRKGLATYLLGRLMQILKARGVKHLVCGMFEEWRDSILLHTRAGFTICRKYTRRRIFRFFPYPPKETPLLIP